MEPFGMKTPYRKLLDALIAEYGEGEDLSSESPYGVYYFHYRWPEFEIYQPYWYPLLFYRPCKPLRKLAERLCGEQAGVPLFGWDCATDYVNVTDPQKGLDIVKRIHSSTMKSLKRIKKFLKKRHNETES